MNYICANCDRKSYDCRCEKAILMQDTPDYPSPRWEEIPHGTTSTVVMKPIEADPDNIPSGERGAKLDKGKPPVARGCLQYFPHAIEAVAKVSEVGASKYSWKGWEAVRDGERRYLDACGRHLLRSDPDERKRDDDTGLLHLAQVAWNALAALELALRDGVPLFDPKKG